MEPSASAEPATAAMASGNAYKAIGGLPCAELSLLLLVVLLLLPRMPCSGLSASSSPREARSIFREMDEESLSLPASHCVASAGGRAGPPGPMRTPRPARGRNGQAGGVGGRSELACHVGALGTRGRGWLDGTPCWPDGYLEGWRINLVPLDPGSAILSVPRFWFEEISECCYWKWTGFTLNAIIWSHGNFKVMACCPFFCLILEKKN